MAREAFIIGDLHQCYDELSDLLDKAKFDPAKHRLISVGDITDRGNGLRKCIDLLRSLNAEVCYSNHEHKYVSYYKAELKKAKTLPYLSDYKRSIYHQLDTSDLIWFDSFPTKIAINHDTFVIHAGCEPAKPFILQSPEQLIRTRYVNKHGYAHKSKFPDKDCVFWTDAWKEPINIICGHTNTENPTTIRNEQNTIWMLDTGCAFGGYLTGFFFDRKEFVQVKARKVYWQRKAE
jgi:hypothetical protein